VLNDVLPESCEFQFKPTDTFASLATAQTATAWATYTQTLGTDFTPNEKRALQADQVPAAHDVLVDDRGQMVMLGDADVQPETDVSLTDATTIPGGDTATPAAAPTVGAGDSTALPAKKDFDATREQFVANLVDLIHGSVNDDVSRRRAGVVMRAQLNSAGKQARLDGLVDGGVTTGLSDADLNAHAVWLAQQSGYVTDFLGSVYKSGLSDAEIDQHAEMWANKSLQSAYFEGLNSADADGTYEFFGEDGKESCADCRRLKGTQMRMSEWTATKQRPGVDTENFDCGGWQCKHGLRRVSATSKAIKKKDYDPSEPRDDHGMWTDAGGGLGGESKPERERPAPSKEPLYRTDFDGVLKEEGLNAKWKLSVQDWAASDYKPITYAQQQLYDGKTFEELQPLAQRYAEKANLIETGMKELPTYDGEVWRTLKLNNLSELQGVQGGALEVGSTMQLKTLSSFSNEPGAYGGAIDRTVLHVKNNQSGVSIEALSMLHNEREVLVPSHTTYRVLGITNRADLPDRTPFGVNPEGIPKSEIGYVIDLEEITQ
jgi:hypothetical protein